MSTKQILRHYFPVFKKTLPLKLCTFPTRTYGDIHRHKHAITSVQLYHRLLRLHDAALSGPLKNLTLKSGNTVHNRWFSYSCPCGTMRTSNFDTDDLKKYTEHEVKQTQAEDPELVSIIKEIGEDLGNDSRKLNSQTIDKEEQKHTVNAADAGQLESTLNDDELDVNKKVTITNFEYDYQVAEDIEEYDYIDQNSLMGQQVRSEKVLPISLQRGQNGVFDLHELVTLLEHLGAENIITVPVPPEANFCDDMVVISAKSVRHLQAINDEMLWVHKRKKAKRDPHLVIEGNGKSDWCAMDLGNIVLHVFYGDLRDYYDIESLWLLGPDADPKCQKQSADSYILSAEDLFWLETGQGKGKVPEQDGSSTTDNDKQLNVASAKDSATEKSDHPDKI